MVGPPEAGEVVSAAVDIALILLVIAAYIAAVAGLIYGVVWLIGKALRAARGGTK